MKAALLVLWRVKSVGHQNESTAMRGLAWILVLFSDAPRGNRQPLPAAAAVR